MTRPEGMTPEEFWAGPVQDAIPQHDAVYRVTHFRPTFPTGSTVYERPQDPDQSVELPLPEETEK